MKRPLRLFWKGVLSTAVGLTAAILGATGSVGAEEPREVARIIIEGSTDTRDSVILRHVRIASGVQVRAADLKRAEERLSASKLFQAGPGRGSSVTLSPNDFDVKRFDLRIRIAEQPWNGVTWGVADAWAAARARNLLETLRAVLHFTDGLGRLRSWRESQSEQR